MQWLTPFTALLAAAVAVPLLLLLYFLKLKRREQIVSSTLLWKRAVQDMQVNAPFQRLRHNILLLLQLLMLLALLLALAGPILALTGGAARRYVLLIDRSASMNATDVKPTRLDEAKKQAGVFADSLRGESFFSLRDTRDQAMVIAFDDHAKVMCNFTSDKRQLMAAIERIVAGDGDSSLAEAVMVAQAFAQSPGEDPGNQGAQETAKMMLFSDGRIADLDEIMVSTDELTFQCIGESTENVGVTAMQARRSYEDPDRVDVFATVVNYGVKPVTTDVQLGIDNDVLAVKTVTIPAGAGADAAGGGAGKVAVSFTLSHGQAGVLQVRQMQDDLLASDDAAWSVLSPPKRLLVLLVTGGNTVLELALKACPLAGLDIISPAEFDANDVSDLGADRPYDVIVLDNHLPAKLPKCRYLVFGRPPTGIDVSVAEVLKQQVIVDWRPKCAVLKHVSLTNLFAQECYKMVLPRDAEVLAEFNETAALAIVRRKGSVFLLAAFDVLKTNWPFEPSFVLFCYNAVSFLGMQVGQNQQANLAVGDPIVVDGLTPGATAEVDGPDFSDIEITANSAGSVRFPGTGRVGIYGVTPPEQTARLFAVNLLNPLESNIAPVREILLSGQKVEAREGALSRANLPLWPFLVGLVLFVACLEWLVYNYKMRI